MKLEGGCYYGEVAEGEPMLKAQCHCRACQHISGGAPQMAIYTVDKQSFHHMPDDLPAYENLP